MLERWPKGLDNWAANYEKRLQLFFRCPEAWDQVVLEEGGILKTIASRTKCGRTGIMGISGYITQLGQSWSIDAIYWAKIDERFFAPRDSFESRLALLDEGEKSGIDEILRRKIEEQESRALIDWDANDVAPTVAR